MLVARCVKRDRLRGLVLVPFFYALKLQNAFLFSFSFQKLPDEILYVLAICFFIFLA